MRKAVHGSEGQRWRRVVRGAVAPEGLARGEALVEQPTAILEPQAGGLVLLPLPADSDAAVEPFARQHVQGGR